MLRFAVLAATLSLAALPALAQDDDLDAPAAPASTGATAEAAAIDHAAVAHRSLAVLDRQFAAFRDRTAELAATSALYCDGGTDLAAVEDAFAAAWVAWAPLDSYQFGPIQNRGAALIVNFWPDEKNFVGRALRDLLKQPPETQADPAYVAQISAAVQGFPALELLLYTEAPECPAIRGISGNLAALAAALYADWFGPGGWAELALAAGPDNAVYLTPDEFTKTLYTALDYGLDRVEEVRLARPLGTYEQSFPTRAEAWRSGLTNALVAAQLLGAAELVDQGFDGALPDDDRLEVMTEFAEAQERLTGLGQPIAEAVKDPVTRFRVETLETKIEALKAEVAHEVGPNLGVDTGFSAADGD